MKNLLLILGIVTALTSCKKKKQQYTTVQEISTAAPYDTVAIDSFAPGAGLFNERLLADSIPKFVKKTDSVRLKPIKDADKDKTQTAPTNKSAKGKTKIEEAAPEPSTKLENTEKGPEN